MKPLLIFPPGWTPFSPYLALPVLKGYLEDKGIEAKIEDVNVDFYDNILSKDYLKECYLKCEERFSELNNTDDHKQYAEYAKAILFKGVYEEIEEAKIVIRSEHGEKEKAYNVVANAFFLINLANEEKVNITFNEISFKSIKQSTKDIMNFIEENEEELFVNYYKKNIIDKIIKDKIDFVGISVTSTHQLIPALILSRLVKNYCTTVKHIVWGGNLTTRLAIDFNEKHPFFNYVDSMIVYEGEEALYKLINAVENKENFSEIPNLCYVKDDKLIKNEIRSLKVAELPIPNFEGFPLGKYFSSKLVLPLYSSRCCYNKCAFCTVPYGNSGNYRTIGSEKIYNMMESLSIKFNTNAFMFVDETFHSSRMIKLAEIINNKNRELYWYCETRLSNIFTEEACKLLYNGGCRKIQFGLESYNQKILDKMKKNVELEVIEPCLDNCLKSGIAVHLFFMVGFPTETREEAIRTINFAKDIINRSINKYNNRFSTMGYGTFALDRHSHVWEHPEEYNITIINNEEEDLKLQYRYIAGEGLTTEEAFNLTDKCRGKNEILKEQGYVDFFVHQSKIISDESIFLELIGNKSIDRDRSMKKQYKLGAMPPQCRLSIAKGTMYREFKYNIFKVNSEKTEDTVLYNLEKNIVYSVSLEFLSLLKQMHKEPVSIDNIRSLYGERFNRDLEKLILYGFLDIQDCDIKVEIEADKLSFNEDIIVIDDKQNSLKCLYNYVDGDMIKFKPAAFNFLIVFRGNEVETSSYYNNDILRNLVLKALEKHILY